MHTIQTYGYFTVNPEYLREHCLFHETSKHCNGCMSQSNTVEMFRSVMIKEPKNGFSFVFSITVHITVAAHGQQFDSYTALSIILQATFLSYVFTECETNIFYQ
jgi:hypothetical protein